MSGLGLILSISSLLIAVVAIWSAWRLRQEFSQIKQDKYYLEQKVTSIPALIESALESLRIQTALLAQGKPVSEQLIRTGHLYHEISAKEAEALLKVNSQNDRLLWLDVRTPAEFSRSHVPKATLIPVEELEQRYQTEISLTAEKIIVYCAGSDRSRLACDFLSRRGFGTVYHMKDGLQRWLGPTEGHEAGGLIQIASKAKSTNPLDISLSTSSHSA